MCHNYFSANFLDIIAEKYISVTNWQSYNTAAWQSICEDILGIYRKTCSSLISICWKMHVWKQLARSVVFATIEDTCWDKDSLQLGMALPTSTYHGKRKVAFELFSIYTNYNLYKGPQIIY